MIRGFETQTAPLNDYELGTLLPVIVYCMKFKVGEANVIAGSTIVKKMKACGYRLDGPRLRKIINHIRCNDLIPGLVSTSQGYYIATSADEIDGCIESLQGRIDATQAIITALQRQKSQVFICHN